MKADVLLTGATGFVGKHLIQALNSKGLKVRALLRPDSNQSKLAGLNVEIAVADIDDSDAQFMAMNGVKYIFHCAGALMGARYEDYHRGNAVYTQSLISAAERLAPGKLKKFVFVSTQAAGGPSRMNIRRREEEKDEPLSWYGKSKLEAEHAVNASSLPWVIIRPAPVYGPGDGEFLPMFQMAQSMLLPVMGNGESLANLIYISDLVAILMASATGDTVQQMYFAAGPGEFTQNDIAQKVRLASGGRACLFHVPLWIARLVGSFNSLMTRITGKPRLLNSDKILEFSQPIWLCSTEKLRRDFPGIGFTAVEDGLARTAEWYRNAGWV